MITTCLIFEYGNANQSSVYLVIQSPIIARINYHPAGTEDYSLIEEASGRFLHYWKCRIDMFVTDKLIVYHVAIR